MSTGAVMSLHGVHAQNIYAVRKRFEYRTRRPARDVDYLAIYETGHAHAVTGIAKISGVLEGTPEEIWKLTKSFAGISAKYFKDYFSGRRKAFAYCISEAARLGRDIMLSEIGVKRAPQSFQYISEEAVEKLLRMSSLGESASGMRYFFGGVHGVGKSTLIGGLSERLGIDSYSSSGVIRQSREISSRSKVVDATDVIPNQDALIEGLRLSDWYDKGGLLDGRFVLRANDGTFSKIPAEVFAQMNLDLFLVLTAPPNVIVAQIMERDGSKAQPWQTSESAMREMQEAELEHARSVSREIHVPLSVIGRR